MTWRQLEAEAAGERLRRLGLSGALVAHVYVPLFFGIVFGWMRVSRTHYWDFAPALTYWILAVQICWMVQGASTWAAQRVLAPWKPPLTVLLICGAALGTPVINICMRLLINAYYLWILPVELHAPVPPSSFETLISSHLIGIFIWVICNLAIVHVLGFARFGFVHAKKDLPVDAPSSAVSLEVAKEQPQFASRLKRPVGRVCLLKAEQHYLRVVGEYGDDLILYRISDAVNELQEHEAGLRVHRSYWVARYAVSHTERGARGLGVRLKSGVLIPVSRSCRDDVLRAGFPDNHPKIDIELGRSSAFDATEADIRAKGLGGGAG